MYDFQLSNSQGINAKYAIIYYLGLTTKKIKTWGELTCAKEGD